MKTRLIIVGLITFLFISCSRQSLKDDPIMYGFMPDSIDAMKMLLDTIKPSDKLNQYDDNFKSIPVNGGIAFTCNDDKCKQKDSIKLQPGIVVTDRKYFEYDYDKLAIKDVNARLVVAQDLFNNYKKQVKAAERLYSDQIVKLEKQSKRSWLEQNMAYIGFTAGVIVAILIQSVTLTITK